VLCIRYAIEGEGFKSLAQTFINIGSKYGSINVEDIVLTSTTVSNRLTKTYDMIKLKVINVTINSGSLGLTLDLWKHDISGAHYIENDVNEKICKIKNLVLATREMTESQTGLNIRETLDLVLNEFGCTHSDNYCYR
jgi:hypothetical protein